jgi:hypothetical protein
MDNPTPREALGLVIQTNDITPAQAGRDIGTTPSQVRRWLTGAATPTFRMRHKIETWCDGKIPADAPWDEPLDPVFMPATLPDANDRLCWTNPPDGVSIDRIRATLKLPNIVSWTAINKRLREKAAHVEGQGEEGSERIASVFRVRGYYVHTEQRTYKDKTVIIYSPMMPLVPEYRSTPSMK